MAACCPAILHALLRECEVGLGANNRKAACRVVGSNNNKGLGTTIDYRVRAGLKVLKLNFSDKNVAVSEILNNFALSNESLRELAKLI